MSRAWPDPPPPPPEPPPPGPRVTVPLPAHIRLRDELLNLLGLEDGCSDDAILMPVRLLTTR